MVFLYQNLHPNATEYTTHVFKPLIIIPVLSSIFVFVSIEDFVFPGIGVLKGTIAGTTIDPAVIFNGYLQKKIHDTNVYFKTIAVDGTTNLLIASHS